MYPKRKTYTLYWHINKINNKVYVGITCQKCINRWNNGNGYKKQTLFNNAIQKYGWGGFEHKIIHENLSKEKACILERAYISFFKKRSLSYNAADGGEANDGWNQSEEIKQRLSDARKGEKNPMYGKRISPESRKRQAESLRGRTMSEKTRKKMSESRKGWVPSDEIKSKISNTLKGKYKGEKNPMYGKKQKPETVERLRQSIIKMYEERPEIKQKIRESQLGKRMGPDNPTYGTGVIIKINNDELPVRDMCKKYNIGRSTLQKRIRDGLWEFEIKNRDKNKYKVIRIK